MKTLSLICLPAASTKIVILIAATLLIYHSTSVFAASGGRMGGNSFSRSNSLSQVSGSSSSSSFSSSPSRSTHSVSGSSFSYPNSVSQVSGSSSSSSSRSSHSVSANSVSQVSGSSSSSSSSGSTHSVSGNSVSQVSGSSSSSSSPSRSTHSVSGSSFSYPDPISSSSSSSSSCTHNVYVSSYSYPAPISDSRSSSSSSSIDSDEFIIIQQFVGMALFAAVFLVCAGFLVYAAVFLVRAAVFLVCSVIDRLYKLCSIYMEKTSVVKLQVGLLGTTCSLQKHLNRIAQAADTSYSHGLTYILTETSLSLLRHSDYCISAYSAVDVKGSTRDAENRFNQLCIKERMKFDDETLVNVNGMKRQSSTSKSEKASGFSNDYIVITILVAAKGRQRLPAINSDRDLKEALQKLASISSRNILAVEVLWTPQNEDDTLSEDEFLRDYSLLRPLVKSREKNWKLRTELWRKVLSGLHAVKAAC